MTMPTKPRIEPTDRSMLRVTMTSTMPVAMTATEAVCTDRFHRLRGVRNSPPEKMWKPIQMMTSAPTMPSRRVSSSVAIRKRLQRIRRCDVRLLDWTAVSAIAASRRLR